MRALVHGNRTATAGIASALVAAALAGSAVSAAASPAFPGFGDTAAAARDDAWSEAGVAVVASRLVASRSFDAYPVDLCGGDDDAEAASSSAEDARVRGCEEASGADAAPGCCTAFGGQPARRWYVTGILGASFGALQSGGTNTAGDFLNTGRATDSLFTAGGALGLAIDRGAGMLRLEVEGRGRDALQGITNSFAPPVPTFFYSVRAVDGWSVMTNAWRDWFLTERLGFYAGGGIGAGGYRLTVDDGVVSGYGHVAGFAWQVGSGATYRLTQRTTLDLGYRFFDTVSGSLPLGEFGIPAGSYVSNFYASELLLSVRIYDPFRR